MMKVTKTTFGMLAKNRAERNKDVVMVQWMKKNGEWGVARETKRFGHETDMEVVERLARLNNTNVRIAQ
jgi:hypothetical protein